MTIEKENKRDVFQVQYAFTNDSKRYNSKIKG